MKSLFAFALPLLAFATPTTTVLAPAPVLASGPAPTLQDGEAAAMPTDEELQEAWDKLAPEDKAEIIAWFSAECDYMTSTQNTLIKFLVGTVDIDRSALPEHERLEPYQCEEHAPKQIIPRKWVAEDSSKAKQTRERFAPDRDPLEPAYLYNWASGRIERVAEEDDPDRNFTNALMGMPPRYDFAEAILMQKLDDGAERELHTAFAHPYTDRTGNAFPGVTLYDAWGSGATMEMPDVDVLGVLHDIENEWKKYVAPVPAGKQKPLYDEVGELWLRAYHHRSLREAFAHHFLRGNAVPNDAYNSMVLAFNARWESVSSDPDAILDELPDERKWEKFHKALSSDMNKKKTYRDAGQLRLDYLEYERYQVKARLVWVMQQYGAI